ncbi:hypothetical protein DDE83_008772 [Stemphylium lycopersici]|uniref:Uncharacterized protein n=1 Tax=Stemphylium lycopersici TaxID=183478 RepID=A0A364MSG6_STELY|nr:hypothetical protein DDE83_008772 [Stemphylium lycopersici]
MRIYPVFHKKLLELAPANAELAEDIELEDDEYEVEEIKDLRKFRGVLLEVPEGTGNGPAKRKE